MVNGRTSGKPPQVYRKFVWAAVALVTVLAVGTLGYWLIGGRQDSFLDVFYMTVITISTIGYAEIIDLSGNPAGRVFTILIALAGIGTLFYIVTNVTALAVEGELTDSFRRRRMEKKARNARNHFIICGLGWVGSHIVDELRATKRPYIMVDIDKASMEEALQTSQDGTFLEGDATDNSTLLRAGIAEAEGLFAVTDDDNQNLVMGLTAKQLNPDIRVVARCNDIKNEDKMRKAGADAVVSPNLIGGLRMASEMIRPTVVSFLDVMLRDREKNLRIEEVAVPDSFAGKTVSALKVKEYRNVLLLAIRTGEGWVYNPSDDHVIGSGNTLVFLATPEERGELEGVLARG